ncbi:STAS domain-containing protein [Streptomyces sp. NBC_01465]|uniref:STAS domain-containing protein n=1 Tax=Streptomyces sp. NBC_01465 TaxID=2903878 RepID=UPI002E36AFF2|nr:STAS domain-containing protein [Streptomyces sp. NBC_01465]
MLRAEDGLTIVEFHGDIDLAVETRVRSRLDAALARQAPVFVVDLRQVTFLDSTGLRLLFRARQRALSVGVSYAVVCAAPSVLRVLRIHDALDLLRPAPTLDGALALVGRRRSRS